MLSKDVRAALEVERETLKLQRRQVVESFDTRIKAIDALLSPDVPHQGTLPLDRAVAANGGPLAGKGLREAMKTVMTSFPQGLRPVELTQKLEQLGYQVTGSLPLKTRVWSETVRLRKEKRIHKRGKRYLWVVPQDQKGNNGGELHQEVEGRLP